MKTPEEIKKALSCSVKRQCLVEECVYQHARAGCFNQRGRDALAYIEQLEDHIRDLTKKIAKDINVPSWIAPKDKMPDTPMFWAVTKYNADPKIYRKNLVDPDYTSEWLNIRNEILWWIPIPEVPKED